MNESVSSVATLVSRHLCLWYWSALIDQRVWSTTHEPFCVLGVLHTLAIESEFMLFYVV